MNIYVGNLDYRFSEDELRGLFEQFGEVASAKIITDKFTGKSKGFAFVEMPDDNAASEAISKLNGSEAGRRKIFVSEARPRENNGNRQ